MDSGMILDEDKRPPFDATAPLLPEEVCWIMDRMFACEVNRYRSSSGQIVQTCILSYSRCNGMREIPSHRQFTRSSTSTNYRI